MRDFERLKELSSAVQLGLEANDVIWAIDQALVGRPLDSDTRQLLADGGAQLRRFIDSETPPDVQDMQTTQTMLETSQVESVRAYVARTHPDVSAYLTGLARVCDELAEGQPVAHRRADLEAALDIFAAIGEMRLAEANEIALTRKEPTSWLRPTMISPFS